MKKVFYAMALFSIFACTEAKKEIDNPKDTAELRAYETLESEEESTKKFIENYVRDLNSPNWKSKLPKYLQPNPVEFLEEHAAFRESFPSYKSTIKHLAVDGNKGIVWMAISANYAKIYSVESKDDDYGDSILKGIKAENQALTWDETWYFDVVDGKFGNEWDFLKDNHTILEALTAEEK